MRHANTPTPATNDNDTKTEPSTIEVYVIGDESSKPGHITHKMGSKPNTELASNFYGLHFASRTVSPSKTATAKETTLTFLTKEKPEEMTGKPSTIFLVAYAAASMASLTFAKNQINSISSLKSNSPQDINIFLVRTCFLTEEKNIRKASGLEETQSKEKTKKASVLEETQSKAVEFVAASNSKHIIFTPPKSSEEADAFCLNLLRGMSPSSS